jgi:uncharacterized membrane protein YfcA
MDAIDSSTWFLFIIVAILIGFAKTGVATVGIVAVTLLTIRLDAKEAIGLLLPMLLFGDVIAVIYYRRSVVWKHLIALIPWVLLGIVAGYLFLDAVDNAFLQIAIGSLIVSLVGIQWAFDRLLRNWTDRLPNTVWFHAGMGALSGFATTIGNVSGVVMSIYLFSKRLPKDIFVGTGAWFYLTVNLIKLPFYTHLQLIHPPSLAVNALLIPCIVIGAILGVKTLPLIPQNLFKRIILAIGVVGAVHLIWKGFQHATIF